MHRGRSAPAKDWYNHPARRDLPARAPSRGAASRGRPAGRHRPRYPRPVVPTRSKPPPHLAADGRQDRIEQAAARASAFIERYFEGIPKADELVRARAALDEAIALVNEPTSRPRVSLAPLRHTT